MNCEEFYQKFLQIKSPYLYQKQVWELIQNIKFPLLIKAPTGSGKTEAVVAPFLSQFLNNKFIIAPRLIYVLPMRVLVNNIANRINKYVQNISQFIQVKVHHGDIPSAPFFISDIIVTTLDQFFYGFVRMGQQIGYHIDMPAGSIASSLIVFDEAHMYRDEFTFSIMRALMEILYYSKIPFILMTATMPDSLEKSLFENIEIPDVQKVFGEVKINSNLKIKINNEPIYNKDKEVCIPNDILDKIKEKKTLIVLNQVGRAQKVYEEIKKRFDLKNNEIVLLHSHFTKLDREENEKKALSIITHKENGTIIKPEGISIIVSTQVLEAGIDFSAELLLTELAPTDCLIQRAGRCARYEGEEGEMVIFPVEDKEGYLPYEKEHLRKTLKWLQDNKKSDIRNFKEACRFVNETLDYQANDYEAKDTLFELYECVLYADRRPSNIQLRKGKPITLVVVDLSVGEGKKKENRIKDAIQKTNIRDNSINVDFNFGWKLLKNKILKYEINFDIEKNEWNFTEVKDVLPFKYYLLEKEFYDRLKGVIINAEGFII